MAPDRRRPVPEGPSVPCHVVSERHDVTPSVKTFGSKLWVKVSQSSLGLSADILTTVQRFPERLGDLADRERVRHFFAVSASAHLPGAPPLHSINSPHASGLVKHAISHRPQQQCLSSDYD